MANCVSAARYVSKNTGELCYQFLHFLHFFGAQFTTDMNMFYPLFPHSRIRIEHNLNLLIIYNSHSHSLFPVQVLLQHIYVEKFAQFPYLNSVIRGPTFSVTLNGPFHCINNLLLSVGSNINTSSPTLRFLILALLSKCFWYVLAALRFSEANRQVDSIRFRKSMTYS